MLATINFSEFVSPGCIIQSTNIRFNCKSMSLFLLCGLNNYPETI